MEHDLVCPQCKSGLVVVVDQARGGVSGEFVSIAKHVTEEEMRAARNAVAQAEGRRAQAVADQAEAEQAISQARTADRFAGIALSSDAG